MRVEEEESAMDETMNERDNLHNDDNAISKIPYQQ
jgi:hypothetical protein